MVGTPYMAVIVSNLTLMKLNAYQSTSSGVRGIQLYFPRAALSQILNSLPQHKPCHCADESCWLLFWDPEAFSVCSEKALRGRYLGPQGEAESLCEPGWRNVSRITHTDRWYGNQMCFLPRLWLKRQRHKSWGAKGHLSLGSQLQRCPRCASWRPGHLHLYCYSLWIHCTLNMWTGSHFPLFSFIYGQYSEWQGRGQTQPAPSISVSWEKIPEDWGCRLLPVWRADGRKTKITLSFKKIMMAMSLTLSWAKNIHTTKLICHYFFSSSSLLVNIIILEKAGSLFVSFSTAPASVRSWYRQHWFCKTGVSGLIIGLVSYGNKF